MISKARAGLAVLGLASTIAFAGPAAAQDMGFYAGAALGQAETDGVCDIVAGFAGVSCDEKDTAWKIFGGYQFNRNFSVELGYASFGEATVTGPGGTATVEGTGFDLVGVGSLPLADRFAVYGKLGLYRVDVEVRNTLGFSADESENGLTFGFGLRFDFTRNLAARLEWQRYQELGDDPDIDVTMMSVGILFRF